MTAGSGITDIKALVTSQTATTQSTAAISKLGSLKGSESFKLGQILQAVTLSSTRDGQLSIKVGQQVFHASSQVSLQQNIPLSLKVMQLQPQLLLKLMPPSTSNAAASPLQQALSHLLPQQAGFAPLLSELAQKAQPGSLTQQTQQARHTGSITSRKLTMLAETLLKAIPNRQSIFTADGLRQAIRDSGLLLEARLAQHNSQQQGQQSPQLNKELKTILLRYQQALSEYAKQPATQRSPQTAAPTVTSSKLPDATLLLDLTPPLKGNPPVSQPRIVLQPPSGQLLEADVTKLQSRVESIIARLNLLQIATADSFNEGHMLWQLEIPVKQGKNVDMLAMTIERNNGEHESEEGDAWTVQLALQLPNLGDIEMRISLHEQIVSTLFWSESESTLQLIETQSDSLRERLQVRGIELQTLQCHFGKPQPVKTNTLKTALIDCQA